jgi:DNA modification methylase
MIAQANIKNLPLAANSIDLIFTDPPYLREYLPCYGWLAQEAARVLKPGGFVLAMCGGSYLNKIFRMFDDSGLSYFWKCEIEKATYNPGITWLHGKPVCNFVKSIIVYSKSDPGMMNVTGNFVDLYSQRTMPDKRFHHWGQKVGNAVYYINAFSLPGSLILDPFIGGGTTAVACELIGRRCISFDLDPVALRTTRDRLAGADIHKQGTLFSQVQA